MNAFWSAAKAKVSHRMATHFSVESFRLRNEAPMVSFTFDDIPKSAATTGAGILEDHGVLERFMFPEAWSARRRRRTGRRSMFPTSSTCTAEAMKSAVTPSRTAGPAISMQRS
jgi:hypothetical protein